MSASLDPDGVVSTVGSLIVGLAIMAVVLGATVGAISTGLGVGTITDDVILGSSDSGTIADQGALTSTTVTSVQQSLGTGVNLSGDSYRATGIADLSPPYTVTIYAEAERNTTDQAVYTLDSGNQLTLWYDESADEWRAFWYNESSRESATATVAAGGVTTPTVVAVRHDGTGLNVSANATTGADVTPTAGGGTVTDAGTWNGTQDELRVFGAALNSSQLTTLRTTPTAPVPSVQTDSRLMFDVRGTSADSRPVYFSGGSVDLSGIEIVDTVAGEPTDGDDWRQSGTQLIAVDGGTLDGAPVAFVTGQTDSGLLTTLINVGGSALTILVIGTLVIAASKLLSFFGGDF
jgi:hypothetical protein